jgi:selenocysteine-specific elongation factor
MSGDEAVAIHHAVLHSEVLAAMVDQLVQLFKSAFVQKQIYALARGKLSFFMLTLLAIRSAAFLGACVALSQFFETAGNGFHENSFMSDSNMGRLRSLVVGTAGHIDHGKTSLIYALTGVDTDRLKEEKQRGISIDLGFAEMQLPDGRRISFVDVPGHERFVRNMLAGAAGMEAVMLIVAANESVMPQTREHFQICQLLGLRHGIVVITKSDLATKEHISQTRGDVQTLVTGSFLDGAPVVEVSAATKVGLDELKRQLALVAARETNRDAEGVVRMPIDRAFAVKGFGTVVTGTLQAGMVSSGETLELLPRKSKVRVRGLQAQHHAVESALAGQRLAVNLAGVEHQDIKRGHVLVSADALQGSRALDVEIHWLESEAPPNPRELFTLHIGTSEASIKIGLYPPTFARLRLAEEVIALPGDHFVIRRPSPAETVGGGVVIDAFPIRRLNRMKTAARLSALRDALLEQRIEILADEAGRGRSITELIRMTGASGKQIRAAIARNGALILSCDERVITKRWLEEKRQSLVKWLSEFHAANANAPGAPLAAARMGLDAALSSIVVRNFSAIRIQGETVALASHQAAFSLQEVAVMEKMETAFRAGGFQPPSTAEVIATTGLDAKKSRALLEVLVKNGRLVRLPDDLIFHAAVIAHIHNSLVQQKGRKFTVTEFKGWMNISRKFAIPLLEYLDQQRVTRREGEIRIVL